MTINYLDDPVETLNLARNALAIAENTQMTPDQIDCHRLIAYGLIRLKRKDEAFYHVQKGISIARQNGLPYLLHITLYGSGMALTYIGEDLQGSLTVVREAIDVAEKHCFLPNSNVLVGWFDSVRNLGLWQEAKQALNRFCECVDLSHPENKGMYLRMKGSLAYSQARFKDAVTAYQHALTVFKEHGSHESRFRRYQVHLGMALIEAGDFQHGVEQIETAYSYWQKGRKLDLARCLHGLGRIRLRQGNPTEAISYLQQALTLVDEFLDKWPTWPYAYVDLAQAQLEMGQVAESLESASFVYSKFKKWGHFLLGEAAFTVGQVLTAQGKQNEAATYLQEARNEWQRLELTHHLPAWKAFVKRHNMTNFV